MGKLISHAYDCIQGIESIIATIKIAYHCMCDMHVIQ